MRWGELARLPLQEGAEAEVWEHWSSPGDKVEALCSEPQWDSTGVTEAVNGTSPTTGLKNFNGVRKAGDREGFQQFLKLAQQLIDQQTAPKFDPQAYKDELRGRIEDRKSVV